MQRWGSLEELEKEKQNRIEKKEKRAQAHQKDQDIGSSLKIHLTHWRYACCYNFVCLELTHFYQHHNIQSSFKNEALMPSPIQSQLSLVVGFFFGICDYKRSFVQNLEVALQGHSWIFCHIQDAL